MITLLDSVGPAIWRASWQAAVLAIVVVLLLWTFKERLAPRWRFLLWGVVLTRLLLVTTPGSPWSVFNIVYWSQETSAEPAQRSESAAVVAFIPPKSAGITSSTGNLVESALAKVPKRELISAEAVTALESANTFAEPARSWPTSIGRLLDVDFIKRMLPLIWLTGCVVLSLRLLLTVFVLRRRLSACRLVTDAGILELLETACRRMALQRTPQLLVTPECLSPCVVGTWRPRVVLPESIVTESTTERLSHVLAHELAHLVRGDLWTNWLMLTARTLHWFNPFAWWTVRELQAEREAACDERALTALDGADRSAYAASIVELAASLSPSGIAPGLIGLFSSTCRLKARLERLLQSPSVVTLRAPIAATLLIGTTLLGLTDSMPAVVAQVPITSQAGGPPNAAAASGGCKVTGTVIDSVTGRPVEGVILRARRTDKWHTTSVATDAKGVFRTELPEGNYDFLVEAQDRVSLALTGRECLPDKPLELPPFKLIEGGFISGKVVDTVTGQPVSISANGQPIQLDFFGPSRPAGSAFSPLGLATVDKNGRFKLRVAPGENFPYFVNTRGQRMAWDTQRQPAVVVKSGETANYDMMITPEIPRDEKLKAARKIVDGLPKTPKERTAQIILEFRKLNHTVDETELWCMLMFDLVALGHDAVPQLCAELDQTTENRMMRRLGFALRAIGDTRAVPALIRAIPKSLVPACSDYGLTVNDAVLDDFMQTHGLDKRKGAAHFPFGRPVREIIGALHKLTGLDFDDINLFHIHLSDDPRRQILQRRIYVRQAQRWQAWWEANWRTLTDDAAYQKVNLPIVNEPLPPVPGTPALSKSAQLGDQTSGMVLSPSTEEGQYVQHFCDLDTGFAPRWPIAISREEAARDPKKLTEWATENGVDLMCVTHLAPDGSETFVLRTFGMKVQEITARDLRNLNSSLAAGKLPEGRPVGELLLHYNEESKKLVPDADGIFLFITREGGMGVIEITDRVTKVADLTGQPGTTPGVGFHKGVRFNISAIVP